jgi:hypothetical protein
MSNNVRRGTPGRLLLLWCALLPVAVLFSWRVHAHRDAFEWTEYPTGLGDSSYYTSLGENDYYEANLRIQGQPNGLYRRMVNPVPRRDERMFKIAREERGRVFLYAAEQGNPDRRVYVKSGEDKYLEFGERKFWPAYTPPPANASGGVPEP